MASPSESAGADAVVSAQLQAFGAFILAHREDITRHWVGAVDRSTGVESSSGLTFRQLLDHFPLLCSELADVLKAPGAEAPREQARRDSAWHGRRRWQQGYRLDEVIREICLIRTDFLIRWLKAFETEYGPMANGARKAAKRLVHDFFDDVMIGSTVQFVEEHDHQIKEFGVELAGERQRTAEATQTRARFLALVSHELRTPLTPILLDLAFLEMQERVPAELRPVLDRIRHNAELEAALIDDLLDATRLTGGGLQLRLEEVDVHELLASEIAASEHNYREKHLALEQRLDATFTKAMADARRLRRAFAALLRNAANVSHPSTRVTVSSRNTLEDHQIEISLEDTGDELDRNVAERVFLTFEEGRRSTFGIGRLGVGRYVARAVIEAHGGTVVAQAGTSRGAVYVVTLPVHP